MSDFRETGDGDPRLNASSYCSECKQRVRVYRKNSKGDVMAVCPNCDVDANRPIGYKKKAAS